MTKQEYIKTLKLAIKEGELTEAQDLEETIYVIDDLIISGDFDLGVRGLDHNCLIFEGMTWADVLQFGKVVIPETETYISDEAVDELETIGYSAMPLNEY